MSKPNSHHFIGTKGAVGLSKSINSIIADDIIKLRVKNLDLRKHPIAKQSSLSFKQLKSKVQSRTASKEEYKQYSQTRRLTKRRRTGIKRFWEQERERLLSGQMPTRNWTTEQTVAILAGKIPTYQGRSIQGHHTYSVSEYPHLANRGEVIYPATQHEHIYGWHGGNTKNSLPGKPIKRLKDF